MFIQPVQAQAYSLQDDALVCIDATKKFEKEYQIKKHLLTTISSVETGRWNAEKKQNLAWPWTVNAQGKGSFFKTKAEAVAEVKRLQKAGVKSIDVGCMQINLAFHGDAFDSVEEAFEPENNVEYGAKFLKNLYENKNNDWIKAAMAYHSSTPHKALRYKKKLASAYELVKQAQNDTNTNKLFMPVQQAEVKKIQAPAKVQLAAAKEVKAVKATSNDAKAWREAKLEAYRKNKVR